jgi:hypothetical protein
MLTVSTTNDPPSPQPLRRTGGGTLGAGGAQEVSEVRDALSAAAAHLLAATPLDVLTHPGYWRHAALTLTQRSGGEGVLAELEAAGAGSGAPNPRTSVKAIKQHDALLATLVGAEAAQAAAALAAAAPFGGGRAEAEWLAGAAARGDGGEGHAAAAGVSQLAQLRLAQWAAAQLGLSTSCGCGAAGARSWELVRRLALCVPPPPALPETLTAAFAAAAPGILDALAQRGAAALAEGAVDIEQLLEAGAGDAGKVGWGWARFML